MLLKTHDGDHSTIAFAHGRLCFTVCTVRPVVDAVASWMATFDQPEDVAIHHMRNWLRFYSQIQPYALNIPYDLIERRPRSAIIRIVRHLKIEAATAEIDAIAVRLAKEAVMQEVLHLSRDDPSVEDIGFSYYDRESFFHRRHVTSLTPILAKDRLSPDQIARIELALRDEIEGCSDARAMLIGAPKGPSYW